MLNISGFFQGKKRHRPLINQIPVNVSHNASWGISSTYTQKVKFWKWFKARPELNSPVMIRVDDTICEVEFFKPDGSPLGRNKRLDAESFWNDNFLYERLKSIQFDRLVTGSGFVWVGKPSLNEKSLAKFKVLCERIGKQFSDQFSCKEVGTRLFLKAIDEDLRLPRVVDYIPSSTVMIEHDRYEIKKYIQYFSGYSQEFSPEEVIHIPLTRIDGKVDGFTPVESLVYELILLWAIKENMLAYVRNGGVPKKIFVLPEELNNSANHKWLVTQLMEKGKLENRHGNMVLTGKVEVNDLEVNPKDMEYKDLALYVTSNIAYALRVPVSRIPYMIGKAQSKGDAGGLAESGYWSMIESDQRTVEMHLNSQLFKKLGWIFKFKKRYKIDDLREAQALNFRVDAVTKIQDELRKVDMKVARPKLLNLLDLSTNEVEEMTEEEKQKQFQNSGLLNRSFMPDKQVTRSPDKVEMDATKRRSAQNNPSSSSQTGF